MPVISKAGKYAIKLQKLKGEPAYLPNRRNNMKNISQDYLLLFTTLR
jgi:hypothetical protein